MKLQKRNYNKYIKNHLIGGIKMTLEQEWNFYENIKRIISNEKMSDGTFIYEFSSDKKAAAAERKYITEKYEIEWENESMIKIINL